MNFASFRLRFHRQGFTILELMVVVVIVTVLAATAIPLVSKYLKKSKTTEAPLNLRKIYDGEVGYYNEEHTSSSGALLTKSFVSCQPEMPALTSLGVDKRLGTWENGNWSLIKFGSDSPVLYSYGVTIAGTGTTASFSAYAFGDIDGDATTSYFLRVGSVDSNTGEVQGGAAIFSQDDLE